MRRATQPPSRLAPGASPLKINHHAALCVIAQAWPAKPLRLIVPFPASGGSGIAGRILAQRFCDAVPLRQITFFPQRPQRIAPGINRELNVFPGMGGRDEAAAPALGVDAVQH